MKAPSDPRRSSAPVRAYAIVLAVLVLGAVVVSTTFGRANQNARPAPNTTDAPARATPR